MLIVDNMATFAGAVAPCDLYMNMPIVNSFAPSGKTNPPRFCFLFSKNKV